jgi:hypothetical protein
VINFYFPSEFSLKNRFGPNGILKGPQGKLIHEKILKSKISCQSHFKSLNDSLNEIIFVNLLRTQEPIPSLGAGTTTLLVVQARQATFLGIDSWAPETFTNTGSGQVFMETADVKLKICTVHTYLTIFFI